MGDLKVSGAAARPTAPLTKEPEEMVPGDVIKEISSAQKRMEQDRISAENPGIWTRTKEVFSSGAKRDREGKIKNAQRMDKLMDDLYAMVFKIYQGMINPQSAGS